MLTDFETSITDGLAGKFTINLSSDIASHFTNLGNRLAFGEVTGTSALYCF